MIDLITYCADTTQLQSELESLGFEALPLPKTPSVRNGSETLALVRVNDLAELAPFTCLTVLGTYEEVFADPDKRAIYDRIYPRTPVVWTDEAGQRQEYVPPEQFGVFA